MDLKIYYQKIRETESNIADEFPVIVSLESPDGGKGGTQTEVTRGIAARMVAEGLARLGTTEEAAAFREAQVSARRVVEQTAEAAKIQLAVVSTAELNKLKSAQKGTKDQA